MRLHLADLIHFGIHAEQTNRSALNPQGSSCYRKRSGMFVYGLVGNLGDGLSRFLQFGKAIDNSISKITSEHFFCRYSIYSIAIPAVTQHFEACLESRIRYAVGVGIFSGIAAVRALVHCGIFIKIIDTLPIMLAASDHRLGARNRGNDKKRHQDQQKYSFRFHNITPVLFGLKGCKKARTVL